MIVTIDPSLTNTAVVRGYESGAYHLASFGSGPTGKDVASRIKRYSDLVGRVMKWIDDDRPTAIYIEGYSFGSQGQAVTGLGEYGGILRLNLVTICDRIIEVAPHTLKKFATGKGAGKKEMVIGHLAKRYDVMFASNDEFDAFGLYRLALVAEGFVEPDNAAQREAANKAIGIDTPKKKKTKKESAA